MRARLGTRLTAPPTPLPPGAAPFRKAVAPKDLDSLQQLRRHVLARQHAVEAVIGHVVREDREAADDVELLEVAKALGDADRRIVLQHVGDAAGLLVADQVFGEAGRGEGRVHSVQRPE